MMKSLLLLGAVFFGAEAESQEIQKLLAYARQLNQTLGSLAGHAAKTRRLQQTLTLAPMPEGCPAACDGIQCAYDDSQAIINQINGGDPLAAMSAAGDLLGSVCLHRTAMTCAASSTECGNVVESSGSCALRLRCLPTISQDLRRHGSPDDRPLADVRSHSNGGTAGFPPDCSLPHVVHSPVCGFQLGMLISRGIDGRRWL
ncbi:unnamed protein product [Cladocopium goreaui]|uniref:Uncharacterized protein n=1 Tax=Cladocopium goreaui TaxID=2562237 RepID=A0A9P1GBX3_9DINO|nr:unnamed protein product [Cladocopium goreaui]